MIEFDDYEKISTDKDRREVINAIKEISASKTRIESEQDLIKTIKDRIKEEFGVAPADLMVVANMFHKQNKSEVEEKHTRKLGLYEKLFETQKGAVDDSDSDSE